ncbi:MAG TPA: hypothetical protein VMU54_07170 [Planctomycetota bacterium]|nr:hypothetical protein [Planctomycetota bacterium]
MDAAEHTEVLERLRDLESWAAFITETLHLDKSSELVKRAMLEQGVENQALRQLRELSWSLRDKLHLIRTQLELTVPLQPADLSEVRG